MSGGSQTFRDLIHDVRTNLRTLGKRAVLTLLGVVMGSCSVVALINIGHNAAEEAAAIFQGMGVDTLVAQVSNAADTRQTSPLPAGITQLRNKVPDLVNIAPVALMGNSVTFKGRDISIQLIGSTPPLKQALGLEVHEGRFLSEFDDQATHAVIGRQLADELSSAGTPVRIGDTLRVQHALFQVIGVLHPRFASAIAPFDPNTSMFIPLQGVSRLQAWAPVTHVFARAPGARPIGSVASDFKHGLKTAISRPGHRRSGPPADHRRPVPTESNLHLSASRPRWHFAYHQWCRGDERHADEHRATASRNRFAHGHGRSSPRYPQPVHDRSTDLDHLGSTYRSHPGRRLGPHLCPCIGMELRAVANVGAVGHWQRDSSRYVFWALPRPFRLAATTCGSAA